MALPAELTYLTVSATMSRTLPDGADVGTLPDGAPLVGQATFRPDIGKLNYDGSRRGSRRITVGGEIVIVDPVPVNFVDGAFTVDVIDPKCADINTQDWTWTVTFALDDGTVQDPITFASPADSQLVNLADVLPVEINPGGVTFINEAAASAASAAVSAAAALAAQAAAEATPGIKGDTGDPGPTSTVPGPPGPYGGTVVTDPAIKALLDNPASETATKLFATFVRGINVDAYGLVGDWIGGTGGSGTNDTAALQALINTVPAGTTLTFTPGKTYRIDSVVSSKTLVIDGNGASLIVRPWDGTGSPATKTAAILFQGAVSPSKTLTACTADASTVTLATPADAAGFAVGDWVVIADAHATVNWDGNTNNVGRQEVNQVTAVDAGVLSLVRPIELSYATAPYIYLAALLNAPVVKGFENITEINPGAIWAGDIDQGPHIVQFRHCLNPLIERVKIQGWNSHAVNFAFCFGPVADRVIGNDPYQVGGGHGYLVRFLACTNGEVRRCISKSTRHTVDFVRCYDSGSSDCVAQDTKNAAYGGHGIGSKRCHSTRDTAFGTVAGAGGWQWGNETFGADYGYTITRPTYRGKGNVVTFRCESTNVSITDPDFTTDTRAIVMTVGATGLKVRGGTIRVTNPPSADWATAIYGAQTVASTTIPVGDITIEDIDLYGASTGITLRSAGVVTLRNIRHHQPDLNYAGSVAIMIQTVAPHAVIVDGCVLDGGTVWNHIKIDVAPTQKQQVSNNRSRAITTSAVQLTLTPQTRIYGNDFRNADGTVAVWSILGDVAAMKAGGGWFAGNFPSTYDGSPAAASSGVVATMDPCTVTANRTVSTAGKAFFTQVNASAKGVTALLIFVGTASGNIDVGVYGSTGVGTAAVPGARKGSAGLVVCPAAGVQSIPLTAAVDIEAGDWLVLAADNATATFGSGGILVIAPSHTRHAGTSCPLPATAGTTYANIPTFWIQNA